MFSTRAGQRGRAIIHTTGPHSSARAAGAEGMFVLRRVRRFRFRLYPRSISMLVANWFLFAIAIALPALGASSAKVDRGLRFDSAGVIDLSARPLQLSGAHAVATAPLDESTASEIIAAPALNEDNPSLPFSATL